MGTRYVIDGYNLLARWRRAKIKPGPQNLQRARDALIAWLDRHAQPSDEITVVFDSSTKNPTSSLSQRVGRIQVVYASDHANADEWIIEHCHKGLARESIIVTNDKQIVVSIRRTGVIAASCEDFLHRLSGIADDEGAPDRVEANPSPTHSQEKPTKELKDDEQFLNDMRSQQSRVEEEQEPKSKRRKPPTGTRPPLRSDPDLEDFFREMRNASMDEEPD